MNMDKAKVFLKSVCKITYVILLRWGILVIASFFLMWYLQYRTHGNSTEAAWAFLDEKPIVFWYSSAILFAIVIVFYGIFNGPFRAVGAVFALVTIIGYINVTKYNFRGTPLLPEDFQLTDQAGTLTSFIDFGELARNILASIMALSLGFLLDYLAKPRLSYMPSIPKLPKKKPKTKKAKERRRKIICAKVVCIAAPRLILIPVGVAGFFIIANPIIHHGGGNYQYISWLGNTEMNAWNQAVNYEKNGFLLGFLYNFNKWSLDKPDNYNATEIDRIKSTYKKESNKEPNLSRLKLADTDYNIIIVLNESFYDASIIQETYKYNSTDPVPNFHSIMKRYPAGYMYSPDYGGGTANIEFEVDTGLSNYWTGTIPYTSILPKLENIVSIANEAKAGGYKTTAVHAFSGGMYKRDYALKKEGFDKFITQDEMRYKDTDGGNYISDRSIYKETLDILSESDDKQLISVITMQNHAPYSQIDYGEEDPGFEFTDESFDENTRGLIVAYLQSVYRSDMFLGEFLDKLSESDEKTVVLFYGDHAPGVFADANESDDKALADLTHLTPYFVWTNFTNIDMFSNQKYGKEFQEKFDGAYNDQESVVSRLSNFVTLPTTTPNCLVNTLYGVLGLYRNAEKILLDRVCSEDPVIASVYIGGGQFSGKAIEDYRLLNYDILGGKQYWLKEDKK